LRQRRAGGRTAVAVVGPANTGVHAGLPSKFCSISARRTRRPAGISGWPSLLSAPAGARASLPRYPFQDSPKQGVRLDDCSLSDVMKGRAGCELDGSATFAVPAFAGERAARRRRAERLGMTRNDWIIETAEQRLRRGDAGREGRAQGAARSKGVSVGGEILLKDADVQARTQRGWGTEATQPSEDGIEF
jgi:hypothetical protein